ncbi:MAG: hypothetical protein R2807_03580 [Chitinophagales bacterium]
MKKKKLLSDILTSITSINEYIKENRSFDFFYKNKVIRRAVERELEIIGEAAEIYRK